MVLVYNDILDRINNPTKYADVYAEGEVRPLLENYVESHIQSTSYDVSIGNRILVENPGVGTVDLSSKNSVHSIFHELDITNGYILKPNEFISVQLMETVHMPDDLCAHIRPRTTYSRLGLFLTSQHINPSYSGILQLGIKNMISSSFKIYPGICIGQIVFETLSGEVQEDKLYRNVGSSKYHKEGKNFVHSKVYTEVDKHAAEMLYNAIVNEKELL